MIKSANSYEVSRLFNIEGNEVVYTVPRYQREYSWGKSQWESLFDDILENDKGYYIGSIICIHQPDDTHAPLNLELVDGQQRLTTLSLLFAAVYQELRSQELSEDQRTELSNLKKKLVLKGDNDRIRMIPQVQNHNHADYRSVLAENEVIGKCVQKKWAGNRKIFGAYRYFQNRLRQLSHGQNEYAEKIIEFLEKINTACLVKIEVESHADAYTLFESLNDRGMPLTAVDLIKNKLLARLEREQKDTGAIDQHFERWNQLLGHLGDDYAIQERFFRQYYNAFKEQLKRIHQVPVATRSNLIQIFEKLINHDARQCLDRLNVAGERYSLLLSRSSEEDSSGLEKPIKDLERIQGAPSHLLLLHLLMQQRELGLSTPHLQSIIGLLVRFFVHRNLTDTPPTRDLTRLFMTVIDKIRGQHEGAVLRSIEEQLANVSASNDTFRQKLESSIYDENVGVTRFILCALAEQSMTKESWVDLWQFENKRYVWTIEHIFPQGEKIPQPWVSMIAAGDEDRAKELQQAHVHKLGNLTISGFNSTLGNKSFEEKRDRTDDKGRPVGYKNKLGLNEDLANAADWSIERINERTTKLAEQAVRLFELQGAGR